MGLLTITFLLALVLSYTILMLSMRPAATSKSPGASDDHPALHPVS